jgi:hypothetical protein
VDHQIHFIWYQSRLFIGPIFLVVLLIYDQVDFIDGRERERKKSADKFQVGGSLFIHNKGKKRGEEEKKENVFLKRM